MGVRGWLIGGAGAIAGAVLLGLLVHPHVGSGRSCEGIGFGCTPERDLDTALVVAVYGATALATLVTAWWRFLRGRPWRAVLAGGLAVTVLVTVLTTWSQLPRYRSSPGPLSAAQAHWERVFRHGRAVVSAGTPLGDALHGIRRTGPTSCRDAYGRATGSRRFEWASKSNRGYDTTAGAATAAALGSWAERLRGRGVTVMIDDPDGDAASDRRLRVLGSEIDDGGVLSVRASAYISELEITASTGCHRS